MPALAEGRVVDRYRVEGLIGSGGIADVYRVRHTALGSVHALKVVRIYNPMIRTRLMQEGRVQASLRHENIVAVTDVIDVDGDPGLVLEYIDGLALDVWLARGRPDIPTIETLFRGALAGVGRAHDKGVVHRDIKPSNILLDLSEGRFVPKVADFGLVKFMQEENEPLRATRTGSAMGTAAYMAPEQMRDAKLVDQRADIWGLGCILYELVCGSSPFDAPDLLSTFGLLSKGEYAPPELRRPDLPPRMGRAIRAALVSDPVHRAPDCPSLLRILDDEGLPVGSPSSLGAPAKPTRPSWSGGPVLIPHSAETGAVRAIRPPPPTPKRPPDLALSRTSIDPPAEPPPAPRARASPTTVLGGLVAFAAVLLCVGIVSMLGVRAWQAVASRTETPARRVETPAPPRPAAEPAPIVSTPPPSPAEGPVAEEPPAPATEAPAPPVVVTPTSLERPKEKPVRRKEPATPSVVAAPPPRARFKVVGEVTTAGAYGASGLFSPDEWMPPGTYIVRASFGANSAMEVGRATVGDGETLTARCSPQTETCAVEVE